ncbi:SH3 domain-containing protein [Alcaligenes faecalis]|uniref:SH3 domain-containing protein n=1 Tax=Alcaligenes faecalis TaxID=511 RepID=UPI0038F73742
MTALCECVQCCSLTTFTSHATMKYLVTTPHRSEYPNPLVLKKGDCLKVGELYQGPENWDNWIYCSTNEHSGG